MSKILITGMTAPQASPKANRRATSFSAQIVETLLRSPEKHEVDWVDPDVDWSAEFFSQYDVVLVGVAPITGLGASRAYGALSTISQLYGTPKLHLFLDAPNPFQITHSFNAVLKTPDSLFKEFYKYRQQYDLIFDPDVRLRVYTAIRLLATETWPITIYPSLPWSQENPADELPNGAAPSLRSLNLDIFTLNRPHYETHQVAEKWVMDDLKSKWHGFVAHTLAYPVISMKSNKFSPDSEVDFAMATSVGALISPAKRGKTWWSYRYPQALRINTPIVTEWREAGELGDEWSVLGAQFEHMSDERRLEIAQQQQSSYKACIGTEELAIELLDQSLGLKESIEWPRNSA